MLRSATLMIALAMLPASGAAAQSDKVTIKIATLAPEGSAWMDHMNRMAKDVYRKTRGRVTFKFFAGGIAGEEAAVLEKLKYGQLDGAALTGMGLGRVVPEARVLELPFLFESIEEYDHVATIIVPDLAKRFEAKGYVLVGWAEGGMAHVVSRTRLGTLDDMARSRCWLRQGDPLIEKVLDKIGARAVALAMPEVLTAVQTGLVDTVCASPLAIIALQWHPHFKYMVDLPLLNIEAGVVIKAESLKGLSEADRKVVVDAGKRWTGKLVSRVRQDDAEARTVLLEKGMQLVSVTEEQMASFRRIGAAVADDLAGELYEAAFLARVRAMIQDYRGRPRK